MEPGACAQCGTCAAVCPQGKIEMTEDGPEPREECARRGEGNCRVVCPRTSTGAYHLGLRTAGSRYEPLLGGYRRAVGAVAADEELRGLGQDGGAVVALARYALEEGVVDAVVGVTAGSAWKPSVTIVEEPGRVRELAGSKFSRVSLVEALAEAAERGLERVLAVGLPCQVNGLAKLRHFEIVGKGARALRDVEGSPADALPEIVAVIGLFCTENFEYEGLRSFLRERDIDIGEVERFDVEAGELVVRLPDGERRFDVKELRDAVPDGCRVCHDFAARLADVSAGSVGTPDGVTTLLIRSERGEELVEGAVESGYLRLRGSVEEGEVRRLARWKRDRALREVRRRLLEEGKEVPAFWVGDYGGIVARADGTFALRVKVGPGGWVDDAGVFRTIAGLIEEGYRVKFTDRQQLEIHGVPAVEVPRVVDRLREAGLSTGSEGPLVRTILACPGEGNCASGRLNTEELARRLEGELAEEPTPYKFKIALSGCTNGCVRPQHNDLGFAGAARPGVDPEKCTGCGQCADVCKVDAIRIVTVDGSEVGCSETDYKRCVYCGKCIDACPEEARYAEEEGVIVWLGGKGGREPVEGVRVEAFLDPEDVPRVAREIVRRYRELAEEPQKERLADTIRRCGVGPFLEVIEGVKGQR